MRIILRFWVVLAAVLALGWLCGCTRINDPDASTSWTLVTQNEMNVLAKDADVGAGRGEIVGLCGQHGHSHAISEVVGRDREDTQLHEFCHLIDFFHGDYHAALDSLVTRDSAGYVPPEFQTRYDRLCAFVCAMDRMSELDRMTPFAHWALLKARYPKLCVIQHADILKGLATYWPLLPQE